MDSFTCIFLFDEPSDSVQRGLNNLGGHFSRQHNLSPLMFFQQESQRFPNDKLFTEHRDCFFCSNGYLLGELGQINSAKLLANKLYDSYQQEGARFINELRGEFSGLLYDKNSSELLVYTSPTGMRPVFYYQTDAYLIVSSTLKCISTFLQDCGEEKDLEQFAAYQLLTFGYMLEDYTLIKGVKRLRPGHILKARKKHVRCEPYIQFRNKPYLKDSEEDLIEQIDELFVDSVRQGFEKDQQADRQHLCTLSGGLDTRMVLLTAIENGFKDIQAFTFSQTGYYDHLIAQDIARDYDLDFSFFPLDDGLYLTALTDTVRANDGLVIYCGSAHMHTITSRMNISANGLIHTGMIGDGILGSLVSRPWPVAPKGNEGAYSRRLLPKIKSDVQPLLEPYETEEEFKLYNRCFNGAMNGHWATSRFSECHSAFLSPELISLGLSIPPILKFKQRLYIKWILKKHPGAAKYIWERTKSKPSKRIIQSQINKWIWKANHKLRKKHHKLSQNPLQHWYNNKSHIKDYMDKAMHSRIELLTDYPDLKKDTFNLYQEGTAYEKCLALTLLEAINSHWNK